MRTFKSFRIPPSDNGSKSLDYHPSSEESVFTVENSSVKLTSCLSTSSETEVSTSNSVSMNSDKLTESLISSPSRLPWRTRLAYSVGHVLNDLCASMWFSYFLLFVGAVLQFDNRVSGSLLLLGQIADAIATPIIGIESDKTRHCFLCRYGKRKAWHLIGTLCVIVTFPFVFTSCILTPTCHKANQWVQFCYYGVFIVIFQFGWAATQVAHVTLITDLTPDSNERVELNAYRHACTVASNICVYAITWVVLGLQGSEDASNNEREQLGPQDATVFRNIVLSVVGIGSVFSILFHVFVPERRNDQIADDKSLMTKDNERTPAALESSFHLRSCSVDIPVAVMHDMYKKSQIQDSHQDATKKVDSNGIADAKKIETISGSIDVQKKPNADNYLWKDWMKDVQFYQIGMIYMGCRLFFNLSQVYTPLYLQETLFLPKKSIAIIPLVVYLSGFISSFVMRPLANLIGAKFILLVAIITGIGACIWVQMGENDSYKYYEIYAVASLFGVTTTMLLIASLALTADMIGQNTTSGAFVFGAMSFLDKLANGVAVVLVQEFTRKKSQNTVTSQEPYWYYQYVLVYVCGGTLIFLLLMWFTILRSKLGGRNIKKQSP